MTRIIADRKEALKDNWEDIMEMQRPAQPTGSKTNSKELHDRLKSNIDIKINIFSGELFKLLQAITMMHEALDRIEELDGNIYGYTMTCIAGKVLAEVKKILE